MPKKPTICIDCGEPVPHGRLACPACGAVLAAVAGSRRTVARVADPSPAAPAAPAVPAEHEPAYRLDSAVADDGSTSVAQPAYLLEPMPLEDVRIGEPVSPWPPLLTTEPALVPRPYSRGGSDAGVTAAAPPPPGAYLPPNTLPATTTAAGSAGPSWPSMATPSGASSAGVGVAAIAAPASGHQRSADDTSLARVLALDDIGASRLAEIAGWFVVVGSAMAILGFLLPWSVVVIGAGGTGGYLDDWGLASRTHFLVVLGLVGVLGLGVVENPVPAWLRTGVLGLVVGGLLIGLTWPYVIGPLGADIGVLVTTLGGLALVIGGGVAIAATRHDGARPAV